MIECWLDPLVDGIGGGTRERDLTVRQIAAQFRHLVAERLPRSVSAILNIAHEQSQGRRERATLGWAGVGALVFEAFMLLLFRFAPTPQLRELGRSVGLCSLVFAGPIAVAAWHKRADAARSRAQLRELRRLALEALETIVVSPWFVPEVLDREALKRFRVFRQADAEAWERMAWVLLGDQE